jgi:hypothetical protein
MHWGAAGWLVIAGIIVVATVAIHPSTRLARRFLEEHVPAQVLADARASAPDAEEVAAAGPPSLIDADGSGQV